MSFFANAFFAGAFDLSLETNYSLETLLISALHFKWNTHDDNILIESVEHFCLF